LHALDFGTVPPEPASLRRVVASAPAAESAKVEEVGSETKMTVSSGTKPVPYTVSAFSPEYVFGSQSLPRSAHAGASSSPAAVYGAGGRYGFGIGYNHREYGLRVVLLPPGQDALDRLQSHNARVRSRVALGSGDHGNTSAAVESEADVNVCEVAETKAGVLRFSRIICGIDAAMRLKSYNLSPFAYSQSHSESNSTALVSSAAESGKSLSAYPLTTTVLTLETLKHVPLPEAQRAAFVTNVTSLAANQGFQAWSRRDTALKSANDSSATGLSVFGASVKMLERAAAVPRFNDPESSGANNAGSTDNKQKNKVLKPDSDSDTDSDADHSDSGTAANKSDAADGSKSGRVARRKRVREGHPTKDPLLLPSEEATAAAALALMTTPLVITVTLRPTSSTSNGSSSSSSSSSSDYTVTAESGDAAGTAVTLLVPPPLHCLPLRLPLRLFASHGRRSTEDALATADAAKADAAAKAAAAAAETAAAADTAVAAAAAASTGDKQANASLEATKAMAARAKAAAEKAAAEVDAAYASLPDQRARISFVFQAKPAQVTSSAETGGGNGAGATAAGGSDASASASSVGVSSVGASGNAWAKARQEQRSAVAAMKAAKLSAKERPIAPNASASAATGDAESDAVTEVGTAAAAVTESAYDPDQPE